MEGTDYLEDSLKVLAEFIKRYKAYDNDTRFLLLLDKLQILLMGLKVASLGTFKSRIDSINKNQELNEHMKQDEINKINDNKKDLISIFDLIQGEFNDFEDYIRNKNKNAIQHIEKKVDEVLLGPYYSAGIEMMKSAEADFELNNNISNGNIKEGKKRRNKKDKKHKNKDINKDTNEELVASN